MAERVISLRRGGVGVVVAEQGDGLPAVLHWGADLGPGHLDALPALVTPAVAHSAVERPLLPRLLPEAATGFAGRPGLQVLRATASRTWAPRFGGVQLAVEPDALTMTATDPELELELRSELRLERSGLLRLRHRVTNLGAQPVWILALEASLPVPATAGEVLDLSGRWCRERSPQRRPFHDGAVVRESRRGRTGHDAPLVVAAGTPGFGFESGEVWAVHVGWSGDHVAYAERLPEGQSRLGGGELLGPGEVQLAPGSSYQTPWLFASWSDGGLNGVSERWHDWMRSVPSHPARPRPVVLNTWEAVYFDHDLDRLTDLATRAADLGIERFVLDDGWFRGRRDDTRGLGDWWVDTDVWPQGLHPLADLVAQLGMEFGLWVEPEMVNPDSTVARAHPDWLLRGRAELPPPWRSQQVLDLTNPQAYTHVRDALLALLGEYDIAALKWDHNRDLIDVAHAGRPAVHRQTLAFYNLLDELRSAHPDLEIESCASGGARIDLEVLQRVQRVWPSDCNDPLERQLIQRWTGLLVPPEIVGCHVAGPVSHTTGRVSTLGLRAVTAFFGHLGVEWDLAAASASELAELGEWIGLHKQRRHLLHTGRVVVADHRDESVLVHGVVSEDATHGIYAVVCVAASGRALPAPVRLPGLDEATRYRLARLGPPPRYQAPGSDGAEPGSLEVSGSVLARGGVALPVLRPETALLLEAIGLG